MPGPKLLGEGDTADFLLQNHDVFFVDNAQEFCEFTTAGVVDGDYQSYLRSHRTTDQILDAMMKPEASCLTAKYWAILPFAFGKDDAGCDRYVKYHLEPVGQSRESATARCRLALDHTDPKQKFIHGLFLSGEGTCCNLPVLYTAISRRLGYPVYIAQAPQHAYCRWEKQDDTPLNFEVISRKGIWFPTDDEVLATSINRCPQSWKRSLFRSMTARELLGYFLLLRADVHSATKHHRLAVDDLRQALLCYPDNAAIKQNLIVNELAHHSKNAPSSEVEHLSSKQPGTDRVMHLPDVESRRPWSPSEKP